MGRRGATSRLDLLAPGAFGPWPARNLSYVCEALECDALARIARRANRRALPAWDGSLAAALFAACGVPPDTSAAALSALADGAPPGAGGWLRADPVHLRANPHGAELVHGAALALDAEEAGSLAGELADIAGEPAPLALGACRWYLPVAAALDTPAPSSVIGLARGQALPGGAAGRHWRQWLTEAQMVLHASEVNAAREAAGKPPVNSIWLWGGGASPADLSVPYTTVYGDDPVLVGLARATGAAARAAVHGFDDWAGNHREGVSLVVLDAAHGLAPAGDVERWRSALQGLEERWLAPAVRALEAGRLGQLTVLAGGGPALGVDRRALRRFWRRPQPLATILEAYADDQPA